MALITLQDVRWGFGGEALLDGIGFSIAKGERIGLLGRNGVGKSSLLRLINREIVPDSGEIIHRQGIRVAALAQEVPAECRGTLFEVVARGLGPTGQGLAGFHSGSQACAFEEAPMPAREQDHWQHLLDGDGGWKVQQQIESTLSRMGLDPNRSFNDLSAGMKRRALFARALAPDPDLLLLDEPTNHLDIDAIVWLEAFLLRAGPTLLFVTHDRMFLERIATRILELDRGRLISHSCDYRTYLRRRAAELMAEAQQERNFDQKLSQEEIWIRQGIKARRTRNEGRVRALLQMRTAVQQRRARMGKVKFELQEAERSGKLVIRAEELTYAPGGNGTPPIVRDFTTTILRGDKIGIIGPNGVGKTTLIRLLLAALTPDSGTVRHGTHLQAIYFDQLRTQLDLQCTVAQNISADNDFIVFNNRRRHVIGYLRDFLFSPERCRTPVHVLSGGERNRLMLAKLFTQPANLLVLDEPTNDLDTETLELLEELLLAYDGTLLLVSHDRSFLNQVVTSTLVFEGNGRVTEYAGGYDDWLRQRPRTPEPPASETKPSKPAPTRPAAAKPKRLSFSQARELKELPAAIETLEAELNALHAVMADPGFYKQEREAIVSRQNRLQAVEERIAAAYGRWQELEDVVKGAP